MKRFFISCLCLFCYINYSPVSAQTWTLLSPLPTYQNIRSVSFPSVDTGYIVTEFSEVIRTTNGGETWEELDLQFDALFVEFLNNNHGYITSFDKVYSTDDGGDTWQPHLVEPQVSCWETYFYNDTIGFAFGWDGFMAKTTDGGLNWEELQSYTGNTMFYYTELQFADLNTGYAVGQFDHTDRVLRRTDDGGHNWVDVSIPENAEYISSVSVLGPDDLWIGAGFYAHDSFPCPAYVYHSTDGGIVWNAHAVGLTYELPDAITNIHFFNQMQGFAMNHTQFYTTSDGGESWTSVYIAPLYENPVFLGVYSWPDPQHGFLAGAGPSLVKTSDGGSAFSDMIIGTNDKFNIVVFNDSLNGIVAGSTNQNATVLYTENGGDNWFQATFDSIPDSVSDVAFADTYNGWAVSGNRIYHTSDGGHNWISLSQEAEVDFSKISSVDLNHLFACGNGTVRKSSDGGLTWADISPEGFTPGYAISAFQFTDTLTGYLAILKVTDNAFRFLKTADGGLTWNAVVVDNNENEMVIAIDFCDPLNGIISRDDGYIFLTHDGGESWNQATITHADYVKMADPQTAIITQAGQKVAVSHDGGQSFNVVYTGNANWPYVHDTWFLDETLGFAAGYHGMIQRYNALVTGTVNPGLPLSSAESSQFFKPNPANDRIVITDRNYERLLITAMNGSIVLNTPPTPDNEIVISSLSPGIYMVMIKTPGEIKVQKLIKK